MVVVVATSTTQGGAASSLADARTTEKATDLTERLFGSLFGSRKLRLTFPGVNLIWLSGKTKVD